MGTGGSRFGAGRPATHVKAEHCLRLTMRDLVKHNVFRRAGYVGWQWKNEAGEETGSIGMHVSQDALRLTYSASGKPIEQHVWLDHTACNYGGQRPWLRCPRCGGRVGVLYMRSGSFMCRGCGRVAYGSQSDDLIGKTWRQQRRLERRLDGNYRRPKGMHHRTYARLLQGIMQCNETREDALAIYLANMDRRLQALGLDAAVTGWR